MSHFVPDIHWFLFVPALFDIGLLEVIVPNVCCWLVRPLHGLFGVVSGRHQFGGSVRFYNLVDLFGSSRCYFSSSSRNRWCAVVSFVWVVPFTVLVLNYFVPVGSVFDSVIVRLTVPVMSWGIIYIYIYCCSLGCRCRAVFGIYRSFVALVWDSQCWSRAVSCPSERVVVFLISRLLVTSGFRTVRGILRMLLQVRRSICRRLLFVPLS